MKHLLALDAGTTSCRALVFDGEGQVLALAQREFAQSYPRPGLVEHDAEEIWQVQAAVADEAMRRSGLPVKDFAGVGITNQRETSVIWDRRSGKPIAPAIVWQDRRTAPACAALKAAGHEALLRRLTGLLLDPYFSATKIAWMLDHVPGARARAEAGELLFGTIDSWLLWKLSEGGMHATDPSNAARTMLFDLEAGDWSDELLRLFDIPRALLPELRPSSSIFAEIRASSLARGLPVAGMIGDQQAATLGQLALEPGQAKCTFGTGCFMLLNTGRALPQDRGGRLLRTQLWEIAGHRDFALEGSVFIGGAAVQWLRDGLGLIEKSEEVEALANSVPDSGGLVFVPALSGLGAPHWDPEARGLILGLTRGSTAAHLARATLEGIAFQVADLAAAMAAEADHPLAELRVDGGAAANDELMQFQADLLRIPVLRPVQLETTALGAAFTAGLATGVWRSLGELEDRWVLERRFEPLMSEHEAEKRQARWNMAVERARGIGDLDDLH